MKETLDKAVRSARILGLPENIIQAYPDPEALDNLLNKLTFLENTARIAGAKTPKDFIEGRCLVSLGCGSPISTSEDAGFGARGRTYEAWMPRLASGLGAYPVIGVDVYPQDQADAGIYDHRQADLVPILTSDTGLVDLLADVAGKVTYLEMVGVITSAPSHVLLYILGSDPFGWHSDSKAGHTIQEMKRGLIRQAARLLRTGGILQIDLAQYVNIDGGLRYVEDPRYG